LRLDPLHHRHHRGAAHLVDQRSHGTPKQPTGGVTGFIEAQRREGAKVSRKVELIESTENQNPDQSILQKGAEGADAWRAVEG
jgi:hypothetical protein